MKVATRCWPWNLSTTITSISGKLTSRMIIDPHRVASIHRRFNGIVEPSTEFSFCRRESAEAAHVPAATSGVYTDYKGRHRHPDRDSGHSVLLDACRALHDFLGG